MVVLGDEDVLRKRLSWVGRELVKMVKTRERSFFGVFCLSFSSLSGLLTFIRTLSSLLALIEALSCLPWRCDAHGYSLT